MGYPPERSRRLAISAQRICGLDASGRAHCTAGSDPNTALVPDEAFAVIALGDEDGCGIRKRDGQLVCWSDTDAPARGVPAGRFTQLVMTNYDVCALRADHHVVCFGDKATAAPADAISSLGTGWPYGGITSDGAAINWPDRGTLGDARAVSCMKHGCCTIGIDHQLACTASRLGAPPSGTFDIVAVLGTHACAVRTGTGGTVCWGDNISGACNVPQHAP